MTKFDSNYFAQHNYVGKQFGKWYMSNVKNVSFTNFLGFEFTFQLGTFLTWLESNHIYVYKDAYRLHLYILKGVDMNYSVHNDTISQFTKVVLQSNSVDIKPIEEAFNEMLHRYFELITLPF